MTDTQATYTCEACKTTFTGTPEEAFDEGWDTPERFLSHCTCPNCTIDKTVWWKIVVLNQAITEEEALLIASYNKMHAEYHEAQGGQDD